MSIIIAYSYIFVNTCFLFLAIFVSVISYFVNLLFTFIVFCVMITDMNDELLQQAGLTKTEAAIYVLLVKNSPATPPRLADLAGESRTNTYKLLETLEEKGLVARDDSQKKLRYWANNPSNLLDGLKKRRAEVDAAEKRFQDSLPVMIDEYFKYSEQPAIRYFHGHDGIKEIYQDQLKTGEPMTFIHSPELVDSFGTEEMHFIRNEFPRRGIHRHVFYADTKPVVKPGEATVPIAESDAIMLTERTWLNDGDLKAPVEWTVYGDKLSVVSLGTEFIGMIIESPQITASFREILKLLDKKIRLEQGYDELPKKLLYTKKPEVSKKR
jgi:sugar-specific transcriptional regulator TrmB